MLRELYFLHERVFHVVRSVKCHSKDYFLQFYTLYEEIEPFLRNVRIMLRANCLAKRENFSNKRAYKYKSVKDFKDLYAYSKVNKD